MTEWAVDGLGFLVLLIGMRLGQPRFLRALCSLAFLYLIVFSILYYLWLKVQFHHFQTHPEMIRVGISAAFVFEGFWKLFANMLLLQGLLPIAALFTIYFAVKWLAGSLGPGARFFDR